jgi:glycogen debranching enzyme
VQGYVYDAKRGLAELARSVWREPDLADMLERQADTLRSRFDEAFWVEERGGFYALALDGKKKRVDSRCSNMGHLLWSGIVPPERVPQVVDQLLSEELWTGWGIRTMASDAAAYNPISYHNGTIWPHDTALAAWGLARHGYTAEARRVGRALIEAAGHFDWSLPEVFAGYARDDTPFPIAYPTAARPQAWAAGTPILLVRVLLGIEPDRERQRLVTTVTDELPSWLDGLRIEGVRAYGRTWTIAVEGGRVTIAEGV